MFLKARLRLSAWYVGIILIIAATVSLFFYLRTVRMLTQEVSRVERQYLIRQSQLRTPLQLEFSRQLFDELQQDIRAQTLQRIIVINGIVVAIVAVGSFMLSTKTLEPLEQALEDQRQFTAAAAHELRTPLTALQTSLEVQLMDPKLSSRAKTVLRENLEDTKHLVSLTESLLHLMPERYDAAQFVSVDLVEVVEYAARQLRGPAKAKHIKISLTFDTNRPPCISGDAVALRELFVILLDNAVQYSAQGAEIFVELECQKSRVVARVRDTGQGIEPKHLENIFKRFYRADQVRQRTGSNLGLGLAIAKNITEAHRGRISVSSEVGVGTTFTLIFPLEKNS